MKSLICVHWLEIYKDLYTSCRCMSGSMNWETKRQNYPTSILLAKRKLRPTKKSIVCAYNSIWNIFLLSIDFIKSLPSTTRKICKRQEGPLPPQLD